MVKKINDPCLGGCSKPIIVPYVCKPQGHRVFSIRSLIIIFDKYYLFYTTLYLLDGFLGVVSS